MSRDGEVSPRSRPVEQPHIFEPDGSEMSSLGSSAQAAAQVQREGWTGSSRWTFL